jgi:arsenate reductase (glutaredoxin)
MIDPANVDVLIYHNPACGTSRNTLALIRNTGVEPHIIEYLKVPPSRELLCRLVRRMGVPLRSIIRQDGTPFAELGLGRDTITDDEILTAVERHPVLLNRPVVITPWGVKLCRPSELVLNILPLPQLAALNKEDGAPLINAHGVRVGPGHTG